MFAPLPEIPKRSSGDLSIKRASHESSLSVTRGHSISIENNQYQGVFDNFDVVQKKIRELQDMAEMIIQQEEEEEAPIVKFQKGDRVDVEELKQFIGKER